MADLTIFGDSWVARMERHSSGQMPSTNYIYQNNLTLEGAMGLIREVPARTAVLVALLGSRDLDVPGSTMEQWRDRAKALINALKNQCPGARIVFGQVPLNMAIRNVPRAHYECMAKRCNRRLERIAPQVLLINNNYMAMGDDFWSNDRAHPSLRGISKLECSIVNIYEK